MKKLLIGLLALGSLNTFASADICTIRVNILDYERINNTYLVIQKPYDSQMLYHEAKDVLESKGYSVLPITSRKYDRYAGFSLDFVSEGVVSSDGYNDESVTQNYTFRTKLKDPKRYNFTYFQNIFFRNESAILTHEQSTVMMNVFGQGPFESIAGIPYKFSSRKKIKMNISNFIKRKERRRVNVGILLGTRYKDFTFITLNDVGDKRNFENVILSAIAQVKRKLPSCEKLRNMLRYI